MKKNSKVTLGELVAVVVLIVWMVVHLTVFSWVNSL